MFRKLKIVAWLGVGMVVIGLPLSFYSSSLMVDGDLYSNNGYQIAYYLAMAGVVLMALGGIITRPRFFWPVSILVGIAYIASLYGWLGDTDAGFTSMAMVLIPGLGCILLGIFVRRFTANRNKA